MDFYKPKAIYLQIADHLCEQIIHKTWADKIPSIREYAVQAAVNPNTMARTYAHLEAHGIIRTQRGVGYFIADDAHARILQLKKEELINETLPQVFKAMEVVNLSSAELVKLYHHHTTKHSH